MGLIESFRRAAEKGKAKTLGDEAEDARRQLRRKMRVYPTPPEKAPEANERELEDAERKAIVSVNGEDVEETELKKSKSPKAA
jgi:hypothetical protein